MHDSLHGAKIWDACLYQCPTGTADMNGKSLRSVPAVLDDTLDHYFS